MERETPIEIPDGVLHERIQSHCIELYRNGHFKQAAGEAMQQVEQALKEKSGVTDKYGTNLVQYLFGSSTGIKLKLPFGDDTQKAAKTFAEGAFSYYRNYAIHDGRHIDGGTAFRIMIIASELLAMVGASRKSLEDVGGVPGLIKLGEFKDEEDLSDFLQTVTAQVLPDDDTDGLFEALLEGGWFLEQVDAAVDVGLLEYESSEYLVPWEWMSQRETFPDTMGVLKLTPLGTRLVERHSQAKKAEQ
jgi:uncharacterized protein (TIGR02391 family)